MIKVIIKRDGTREPFQAEKVNGWGIWAAKTLGKRVDWGSIAMKAVSTSPEECTSNELQYSLITHCLDMTSWPYNRMAGRLYAAMYHKELYGAEMPTIKQVHANLIEAGYMKPLSYTDEDYAELEGVINHRRDFNYAHFQLYHMRFKYALRNRLTGAEMETPQFTFMRMAMALGDDQPQHRRLADVKAWYKYFSKNIINAPTPNYVNLGTHLNGYASCCLYTVADNAESLGIGDHIGYKMTVQAAGIGNNLRIRSVGDPIRGGLILHQGKLPYYRAMVGAISANKQNGRAGACNTFYSAFDPDINELLVLKNPMTPADKQIRGMDYTQMSNKFLGRKAARDEQIFSFNCFTAPDLEDAFYSGDEERFADLYAKYEADETFVKKYVPARQVVLSVLNEAFETGRAYLAFIDEINRHTPFKDKIVSSNLCVEITEPTEAYESMMDLYSAHGVGYISVKTTIATEIGYPAVHAIQRKNGTWDAAQNLKVGDTYRTYDEGVTVLGDWRTVAEVTELKREPEVAMCSLAALVVSNIKNDEEYEEAMYYALLMIDKCIHMSEYVLPHIGYTAKKRLSAGVGITDLAQYLA